MKVLEDCKWLVRLMRLGRPLYVLPVGVSACVGYLSSSSRSDDWLSGAVVAGSFFLLGMAAWMANEIVDRKRDESHRTKRRWGLYVSGGTGLMYGRNAMAVGPVATALLFLVGSGLAMLFTISVVVFSYGLAFTVCGLLYSLEPVHFKRRGLLGAAITAVAAGGLSFMGGVVSSGQPVTVTTLTDALLLSFIFLGGDCIAHALDYREDCAAGERTVAVALGMPKTLALARLLIVGSLVALICVLAQSIDFSLLPPLMASILAGIGVAFLWLTRDTENQLALSAARVITVPMACASAITVLLA